MHACRSTLEDPTDDIIRTALAKSPADRFTSALEMKAALRAVRDWGIGDGWGAHGLPRLSYSVPSSSATSATSIVPGPAPSPSSH